MSARVISQKTVNCNGIFTRKMSRTVASSITWEFAWDREGIELGRGEERQSRWQTALRIDTLMKALPTTHTLTLDTHTYITYTTPCPICKFLLICKTLYESNSKKEARQLLLLLLLLLLSQLLFLLLLLRVCIFLWFPVSIPFSFPTCAPSSCQTSAINPKRVG